MLNDLKKLSASQNNLFKDVVNKLLTYNFLSKDKKDNKDAYYFIMSYKDLFDEFFSMIGLEIVLKQELGALMLKGDKAYSRVNLKRDETLILLILRVLYHEKSRETSLIEHIVVSVYDIVEKYNQLQIKKRLNKSDIENTLRLLRKYNLIEATGDLKAFSTKIAILPTILLAISSDDINEVYETILRIAKGDENNEEVNEN